VLLLADRREVLALSTSAEFTNGTCVAGRRIRRRHRLANEGATLELGKMFQERTVVVSPAPNGDLWNIRAG
jgi:hypothetical protein